MCRIEIEAEIRLRVDELMREELKNLKLVRIDFLFIFINIILIFNYCTYRQLRRTRAKARKEGRKEKRGRRGRRGKERRRKERKTSHQTGQNY